MTDCAGKDDRGYCLAQLFSCCEVTFTRDALKRKKREAGVIYGRGGGGVRCCACMSMRLERVKKTPKNQIIRETQPSTF